MPIQHLPQLDKQGPKRLLSLDGGGVRGILTLSFLSQIEKTLRKRYGKNDLLLCDYFDLIGGTSTGAIIAASLATGHSVQEIQELYQQFAKQIFRKRFWRRGILFPKYSSRRLQTLLEEHFGAVNLGDPSVRTGLAIVIKRLDTGSPQILTNFTSKEIDSRLYPLSEIVLASSAAPSYFPRITGHLHDTGSHIDAGEWVDGGVTPYNNPALKLLMIATISGYHLSWPLGPDKLLLISVGTGSAHYPEKPSRLTRSFAIITAARSLVQNLRDDDLLTQTILQWFSATDNNDANTCVDDDISNLEEDVINGRELLSYFRYNVHLDPTSLMLDCGIKVSRRQSIRLREMDDPANVDALKEIGDRVAEGLVNSNHFPPSFDLDKTH